ncbi:MAG: peptide/nickel transport system permease protein [Thermoleophilaceae bacterium]|nr:peptide/nickel transport system permease protein [Thermoleophilaceae bacterium]
MTDVATAVTTRRRLLVPEALRGNYLVLGGGLVLLCLVLVAVFAPLLAPFPEDAANATHAANGLQPPSSAHWFGTDQVGRDIFSRVLYGTRVSLEISALVLIAAVAVGVPLGVAAGYFGGFIDDVIMRVTDVFLAFPALLLALALAAVLGASAENATLALAITWWPWYARLARGQAASVAGRQYIESARALGLSNFRIIGRHVLPNSLTPVLVQMSLDAGGVIITVAGLSFLGLGAQDPTPEWGLMVAHGQAFFTTHWWVATFPGVAILLAAMAFNLVGDGLREALDPKRVIFR